MDQVICRQSCLLRALALRCYAYGSLPLQSSKLVKELLRVDTHLLQGASKGISTNQSPRAALKSIDLRKMTSIEHIELPKCIADCANEGIFAWMQAGPGVVGSIEQPLKYHSLASSHRNFIDSCKLTLIRLSAS